MTNSHFAPFWTYWSTKIPKFGKEIIWQKSYKNITNSKGVPLTPPPSHTPPMGGSISHISFYSSMGPFHKYQVYQTSYRLWNIVMLPNHCLIEKKGSEKSPPDGGSGVWKFVPRQFPHRGHWWRRLQLTSSIITHTKIGPFKPIRFCYARMMSAQSWSQRHHWFEPT